jgi:hypothetical protein
VSSPEPAKTIASVFALAAFAVAIIAGLSAGNTPARVLGTALAAMLVCHIMGLVVGAVGERVVIEHLNQVRSGSAGSETQAQASAPVAAPTS